MSNQDRSDDGDQGERLDHAFEHLVQSALDVPAPPLREDQLEALVRIAVQRRSRLVLPVWALLLISLGFFAILGLAWQAGISASGLLQLALLIPLVNLALSPLAAFLIIKRQH